MFRRVLARTLVAGVLAAAVTATAARAQSPAAEKVAAAKEMMQVAGVAKQFDEFMPVLIGQMAQSFLALAPDKATVIGEVFEQISVKFSARKGELIDQVATLYAAQLTLEELQGILAFYKSPLGVRFIAVQPQVAREAMVLGQRWGAEIGREIDMEVRQELRKRGVAL
jgi:uncharacterized protein